MEMITENVCNDCGQTVTPGEHSGHNARFTGAWYCHDCGALCDGPDDPEMVWLSLLEEPPRDMESIARLWDWSRNFDFPTPATVFLCLIAWEDLEGVSLPVDQIGSTLGYIELGLLADALNTYADRPTVAAEYIRDLLEAEAEL